MRRGVGWLALAVCLFRGAVMGAGPAAAADDVVEETAPLAVTVEGQAERLEALVVRPAAEGRFPIALIVNGHFDDRSASHPAGLAHLAHDFAHRGWLAAVVNWRGYGSSSGDFREEAGSCAAPAPRRYLDARAADLAGALAALRTRPDADPAVAVGLGVSIGGAAMLDFAAGADRPLAAVVNVSGGLYHHAKPNRPDPACGPFEADLVRAFGAFGAAHVPTLWIYSENDPWFRPSLVRRMAEAYRQGGGIVDLEMLRPYADDGHTLFKWEANLLTQPLIDAFLRAGHLPALPGDEAFLVLASRVGPDERDVIAYYLRMPTEKALALPDEGAGAYFSYALRSAEAARQEALLRCASASRAPCHVAAVNQVPSDASPALTPPRAGSP